MDNPDVTEAVISLIPGQPRLLSLSQGTDGSAGGQRVDRAATARGYSSLT